MSADPKDDLNDESNINNEIQISAITSKETFEHLVESFMIISIAGFGGALAGLSIARRRQLLSMSQMSSSSSSSSFHIKQKQQQRLAIDSELPNQWAITCMGFTTVLEMTRRISPMGLLWNLSSNAPPSDTPHHHSNHANTTNESSTSTSTSISSLSQTQKQTYFTIISDYTLGGAFAGAIFQNSMVAHKRSSGLANHPRRRGNTNHHWNTTRLGIPRKLGLTGILPGLSLGFLAGCFQSGLSMAQHYVNEWEQQQQQQQQILDGEDDHDRIEITMDEKEAKNKEPMNKDLDHSENRKLNDLEMQIKQMSIQELQENIQKLRMDKKNE